MEGFRRVPSALKLLLIEIFAVMFFPVTVGGIVNEVRPGTFAASHDLNGVGDWIMALVGPLLVAWVLKDIFRPRVRVEGWRPYIGDFDFCSTHPSYVLIDAIAIAFAAFIFWIGMSGEFAMGAFRITLTTALFFPFARLTAWYLLGLKSVHPEAEDAYKPALWAFCIFAAIFGVAAISLQF